MQGLSTEYLALGGPSYMGPKQSLLTRVLYLWLLGLAELSYVVAKLRNPGPMGSKGWIPPARVKQQTQSVLETDASLCSHL